MASVTRDQHEALVAEVGEKAALSFDSPMAWVAEGWPVAPFEAHASSIGLLRVCPTDIERMLSR